MIGVLYLLLALVAGALVGWLSASLRVEKISAQLQFSRKELEDARTRHATELEDARTRHAAELEKAYSDAERRIEELKESQARLQASEKAMRQENEKQWQLKFDKMKEELTNLTTQSLASRQSSLQQANREQIGELLRPIREQFESFRKSVDDSRTANEVQKKELKNSFESTMKLFEQQQENAVKALREETARIGNDAANLTKVLRRDSKMQGDWGEMILDSLLESSGLERDVHYFVQENVKDDAGRNFRPDVIVKFPEGKSVIIDSKVSITAYAESFEADNDADRQRKLKEHARSVRRHVDELAEKKYDELVSDSIGLVLMFIPNDQCYLAALDQEKELGRYAYTKGIVIISPSNLMIALQLAYNMWQQDRQTKNVEKIVKTAGDLYEKVAGFSDTLEDVALHIQRLNASFDKARSQLYDGKGNIMRRVESLRDLGLTPKKQIKGID